jgi:hypothetical protein
MVCLTNFVEDDYGLRVLYEHHQPFDRVNGLGKTKEELEQTGVLLKEFPLPITYSKLSILYLDKNTKKPFYVYRERAFEEEPSVQQM